MSYKAFALRDELASELKIRLPSITQTKSVGAGGEADLLLGAGTTTTDSMFVRITPVTSLQKDVLGLSQTVFTPHIAQVVIEKNYAGTTDNVADVGTWATRLAVLGALVARGIRVDLYQVNNGTGVSASGITGAPAASFEIHPQYPMMASN